MRTINFNEEDIKQCKLALAKQNLTSLQSAFLMQYITNIEQENKQLKDNWNKLKKWLEKELGDRLNPNKDKWLTGVYDAYRETIDKMKELEQGSDNNE